MGEDFTKIVSRYARKSGRGAHSYGKYIVLIGEDKYMLVIEYQHEYKQERAWDLVGEKNTQKALPCGGSG